MNNERNILCIPKNDTEKRFLLGKSGSSVLLAIGLNPSTANEEKLDPTSRNVQAIANNNGCDGWLLINLYPQRTSKPCNLPKKSMTALSDENINFIRGLIENPSNNFKKVLCCWGDHVEKHTYLNNQAIEIMSVIEELNLSFQCIGVTKSGNPFHPSPMPVNRFLGGINNITLKSFEPNNYKVHEIKKASRL